MPKKESNTTAVLNKYTAQFKEQALERADKDGIPKVPQDLRVAKSMLYSWRAKHRQTSQPFEDQKLQQAEMARLKQKKCPLGRGSGFSKNGGGVLCKTTQVKYAMIKVYSDRGSQYFLATLPKVFPQAPINF